MHISPFSVLMHRRYRAPPHIWNSFWQCMFETMSKNHGHVCACTLLFASIKGVLSFRKGTWETAAPKQDFNPCPAAVLLGVSQHWNSASCPSWLSQNYVLPVSPDHAKCKGKSQLHFRQMPGVFLRCSCSPASLAGWQVSFLLRSMIHSWFQFSPLGKK